MILIINTSQKEYLELILAEKPDSFKAKKIKSSRQQSEKLLPSIAKFLAAQKIPTNKISGIGVVSGPGNFTSLRIGVAVANAFGYAWQVPVVGAKLDEFASDGELCAKIFSRLKSAGKKSFVMPFYDREPNITMPKE